MVVVPSLLNSSAIAETIAELDMLLRREATRRAADLAGLGAAIGRLDALSIVDAEPWQGGRGPGGAHIPAQAGSTPAPAPTPYVPLPRRTTHGGDFGPAVRAKLVREALEKREW